MVPVNNITLVDNNTRPMWYNLLGYEVNSSLSFMNWNMYNIVTFSKVIDESVKYLTQHANMIGEQYIDGIICNAIEM